MFRKGFGQTPSTTFIVKQHYLSQYAIKVPLKGLNRYKIYTWGYHYGSMFIKRMAANKCVQAVTLVTYSKR